MQQCYQSGTRNIPSQLLKNYYLRDLTHHHCLAKSPPLHLVAAGKEKRRQEDNSIVVVRRNLLEPIFYRIKDINDDLLTVTKIQTEEFATDPDLQLDLPWSAVGIKKFLAEFEEEEVISRYSICGKGVIVAGYICEFQSNWLLSKRSL